MGTLTEHGLQPHQAAYEVVKVHSQVGLRVPCDNELVQLLVELEAWPRGAGQGQGGAAQPGGGHGEGDWGWEGSPAPRSLEAVECSIPPWLCGLRPVTFPL